MSHGITSKDSMFSVRERPWHGLGVVLARHPRSLKDALDKSGLGWRVVQVPIYRTPSVKVGGKTIYAPVDGYKANVRKDTGDVLGIVTDRYQVVQNEEAFGFLADLLGTDARFETAGSLHAGRRVFVTVKATALEWIEVGGDHTDLFVNFFNSHDGGGAVQVVATPIRTVCQNTWTAALGAARGTYSMRHVGDVSQQIAEARQALEIGIDYGKQFKKFGDKLAKQKIAERKVMAIAEELWPGEGTDRTVKSAQRRREAVVHLFLDGDTRGNAPGTKWSAANAFLEQIEWGAKVRSPEGRLRRHLEDPEGQKARALDMVVNA